ncbi:MAG: M48 family metalloprotease [Pseudomonadota bacterium]
MRYLKTFIILFFFLASTVHARTLIRDAETEYVVNEIFTPLSRVVYGDQKNVELYIVSNPLLNAYVTGGQKIFIHTGLIIRTEKPEQLAGVLAHELGHITGGHLLRSQDAASEALIQSLITTALVGIAATATGGNGGSAIAGSLIAGSQAGAGSFTAFTRMQEAAADQAAFEFLRKSMIGVDGLVDVMTMLSKDEYGAYDYMRSHPLSRDRIDLLQNQKKNFNEKDRNVKKLELDQNAYDRIKAKLVGFLEPPEKTIAQYENHPIEDVRVMGVASALHKSGQVRKAYNMISGYLKKHPKDGFMHDLAGQIALESGLRDKAMLHYEKAYHLTKKTPLIGLAYGQALIASEERINIEKAVPIMKTSLFQEKYHARGFRDLSVAYDRLEKPFFAAMASAQYYYLRGQYKSAMLQAERAMAGLPKGSSEYVRANDIYFFSQEVIRRKKR